MGAVTSLVNIPHVLLKSEPKSGRTTKHENRFIADAAPSAREKEGRSKKEKEAALFLFLPGDFGTEGKKEEREVERG